MFAEKHATKYFKRRPLPTQAIESLSSDGTMEFSIKVTHEMEILPIIKYWIPYIYVIEPQWLKEIVEKDLKVYTQKLTQLN